jgi:gluconokinase
MNDPIYPRSPRETMDGWTHLPRYIDKIRLHLAGKLHPDYQPNLGKGFDGMWLAAAGLTHEQMVEVVKNSITDGQVCDWVRQNVKKSPAEKAAHCTAMCNRPAPDDATGRERLALRKAECGLAGRDDIRTFVELLDADERRA